MNDNVTCENASIIDACEPENLGFNDTSLVSRYACSTLKRVLDVVFSFVVIALMALPLIILAVAVAADTKAWPIYRQQRVGANGSLFNMYKLRTMVSDADDLDKYLSAEQMLDWEREGKIENDPRVTKLGKILRGTSLDEVPQFLNVLYGDMSVIGPRPITEGELHWFDDNVECLLAVKPGITGYWQTTSRNEATFESGERQRLELHYARNASLKMDACIFLDTFGAMLRRTGR